MVFGILFSGCRAEEHPAARVVLDHSGTEMGVVDLGSEVTQTSKGTMRFVGRIIDSVKRETVDGCHIAYAVTNSPHDPKLHVLVDGRPVAGFDDVIWHSLETSADGNHFAFVANRDGRQVCVRDGTMGQSFEKIGRSGPESGSPLVFSPDGRQLGYAARMDGAWHVVLDGTVGPAFDDLGSMMTTGFRKVSDGSRSWERYDVGNRDCPQFSADGRHVFYLAQRKKTDRTRYVLVLDGKPGPEYEGFWGAYLCPNGEVAYVGLNGFNAQVVFDGVPETEQLGTSELVFSADGKRHAYSVGKAGSGVHSVIVDGKQGGRFGTVDNLKFSADGNHVAFNTYVEASGYGVVMDDALIPPVDGFRISRVYFSGDGERTVFLGEKKREAVGDKALIENGKVIAMFPSSYWLFLSPDCRRIAYSKVTPGRGLRVVLDGVEHPEMASIDFEKVKFSGDSRHFSYVGKDLQQRSCVIVDGVVGPQLDSLAVNHPVFSSAGYGLAYAGRLGADWVVVTNGVLGPKLTGVTTESFVFSPDGQEVAYIAKLGGEYTVVRDTVSGPCFAEVRADSLQFSPDGKHLAYVAAETELTGNGRKMKSWRVVMDGVPGAVYAEIGSKNVIFSSDGRHWAYVARRDREEYVVIDGIEGPRFASIEAGPKECRDGRLEYLAFDSGEPRRKLMRVTVNGFGAAGRQ